ncbi:MAG: GAF domain-containing protein, partial [SAR324 cluster bacterium]|nr:GAF domain-containing protein [SAR324 cluster bacterium]
AGELNHRIDVRTGDELQALAEEFNQMAGQLQAERTGLEQRVEERTYELAETLEQQTAIADILRVISSSPTDLAPVFDTILEHSTRLCDAELGFLFLHEDGLTEAVAFRGGTSEFMNFFKERGNIRPHPDTQLGQIIAHGRHVQLSDYTAELRDRLEAAKDEQRTPELDRLGKLLAVMESEHVHAYLGLPLLKEQTVVGAIVIYRREVRAFTDKQIALARTFADQAVIAIENARLLEQLQARTEALGRSVEELRALGEVSQAVSSTLELQTVLTTVVSRAVQISHTAGGVIMEYDEQTTEFVQVAAHQAPPDLFESWRASPVRFGEGAMGRAAQQQSPVQVADILDEGAQVQDQARAILADAGFRSLLAVPLLLEKRVMGGLVLWRREQGEFDQEVVNLMETFAAQSTLAIQNARLFREIEERGRELELASKHKSQFLANMSHELRTPLNAILGYTELILDSIYGEVPEKVGEVLERVRKSGSHLLGLINAVLDLSKIEAGQLSLSFNNYSMQDVVQTVFTAVESLAAEKQLTLEMTVPPDLPMGNGDEQRITQVLLNLVGNAIKFTEAGKVGIEVGAENGSYLVSVSDTGPGIPEEDQEKIFGEFQQADITDTKNLGGTGLGLAIAKKFVEMHHGRIWVESKPGEGSTFRVSLPVRVSDSEKDHE